MFRCYQSTACVYRCLPAWAILHRASNETFQSDTTPSPSSMTRFQVVERWLATKPVPISLSPRSIGSGSAERSPALRLGQAFIAIHSSLCVTQVPPFLCSGAVKRPFSLPLSNGWMSLHESCLSPESLWRCSVCSQPDCVRQLLSRSTLGSDIGKQLPEVTPSVQQRNEFFLFPLKV